MSEASPVLSLRQTVTIVAALNLVYFGIEVGVALAIGSVSLLADGIDFFEDTAVNLLILLALSWSLTARVRVGMALAGMMLIPAVAALWMLVVKVAAPLPPEPVALSLTGAGALLVNLTCALLLAKHRSSGGSLTRAAFLSSRNDVLANIAIVAAGGATVLLRSGWPDIVVGAGIGLLNLDAAREVWTAARNEHREVLT